jgi:methionyl-tRNA synthetase
MIFKNMDGVVRSDLETSIADDALEGGVRANIRSMQTSFDNLNFSTGLENWMNAVFACNQYVDEQAPWALRKTDPERMAAVLMTLFRCVRDLAIAVRPVVPDSADRLLDQLGIAPDARDYAALDDSDWFVGLAASGFTVGQPVGVFPRLEVPTEAPA